MIDASKLDTSRLDQSTTKNIILEKITHSIYNSQVNIII
jgi:hypothetical protein